jgi:hypothetical protein
MAKKAVSTAELRRRVQLEQGQSKGEELKTAEMFRLERRFGADIYTLLAQRQGTGDKLAKKYGVTKSVISKWRKRLGIEVSNPTQYKKVNES